MNAYLAKRGQLVQMMTARAATAAQIAAIERQVRTTAERCARAESGRARQFGRHSTMWGPPDERRYQVHVAELSAQRAPELDALTRRLARQDGALGNSRRKHGFNEPIGYMEEEP